MSLQRQYQADGAVLLKGALPPEALAAAQVKGFHGRMQTGDPFRDPSFLKLR